MIRETWEEKEVTKKEKTLIKKTITCNKCGNSEDGIYEDNDSPYFHTKHNIQLGFGYGSKFDMENWSFDLCDQCLEEIVKTFKHPPDGFMEDNYSFIDNDEEKQKVFDHYKETGEWKELKYKSYDKLKKYIGVFEIDYINDFVKENFPDKPLLTDDDYQWESEEDNSL